jgi:hypothetical protein
MDQPTDQLKAAVERTLERLFALLEVSAAATSATAAGVPVTTPSMALE